MTHRILITISVVLLVFAVTPAIADNYELAKEVMDIHDVAMARMTEMHELKLQLLALEKKSGPTEQTTAAVNALQDAHKGMMGWMRQYKHPKTPAELKSAKEYLLSEKLKIQEVSNAIFSSINTAEKLLK